MTYPAATPSLSPIAVGPVVKTLHIGLDLAIDLGFAVLVSSSTEVDSWYEVREQTCGCKSFAYRGHCRHLGVAIQAQMMGIETATPVVEAPAGLYYDAAGRTFTADELTPESRVPRGKAALALSSLADD